MQLKLMKISTKSFVVIFSTINVIAGFGLGALPHIKCYRSSEKPDSLTHN